MVAYNFQHRFVEPILAGTKCQTIRADRKRHARPGEEIQLYTGMRTRHCKLIAMKICVAVTPVHLSFIGRGWAHVGTSKEFGTPPDFVGHDGTHERVKLDEFARRDGFTGFEDMRVFWRRQNNIDREWSGVMITWLRKVDVLLPAPIAAA